MNKISIIAISLLSALLASCATPFQPVGLRGGYSDFQLNKNTFKVSFRGNGFTSLGRVQNLLLYRAAQIAKQNGYRYFVVLTGGTNDRVSNFTTPTTVSTTGSYSGNSYGNYNTNFSGQSAYTYGSGSTYGNYSQNTLIQPGQNYQIHKFKQTIIIRLINKSTSNAINANIILKNKLK